MTDRQRPTGGDDEQTSETQWARLADAEPIALRDPLAEVLGMVPEGEPLVFTFAEVAKAAGHACPAVAGAYRTTQLALSALYGEEYPVRSEIRVTVGGAPDAPGFGPMASVMRQLTGAADETGFAGFGGYGGREDLLTFDPGVASKSGRAFEFARTDTGRTVRVTFDPSAGSGRDRESSSGGPSSHATLQSLVGGEASEAERAAFLDRWHGRVGRILTSPAGPGTPFALERV